MSRATVSREHVPGGIVETIAAGGPGAPAAALRMALRFANRDLPASADRVDGRTLALYRIAAGVTGVEVARALDSNRQYVNKLETQGAIIATAGRYRAAVDLIAAERGT